MRLTTAVAMRWNRRQTMARRRGAIAALALLLIICTGSAGSAWALQILGASDHAELVAEMSATQVNRIALDGDRVSRVIESPGGFSVEHDPVRGDLYLYPDAAAGSDPSPVTLLYVGTERGFTYRLTLSAVARDSAQILIRNPAVARPAANGLAAGGNAGASHKSELISLIVAIARREPAPGYVIVPGVESGAGTDGESVVESWRGRRFTARILRIGAADAVDAQELARAAGASVVAAWVSSRGQGSPPGQGLKGDRIAVLIENNASLEPVR